MPKSPEEMAAAMVANMQEKTGRTLDEWLPIARATGITKHRALLTHIKDEYGITYGYANTIAFFALKQDDAPEGDELVEAQYAGAKAGLRPVYDKLIAAVRAFGKDVELAPKKAYVSLRRSKQFGLLQPSTKTRLDVGIKCKDLEPTGRLEAAGSWNAMVTHRVRVTDVGEVDAELIGWLRTAYESA